MPADWVERANAHGSASYDAWTRARPANDFATMRPYLEKTLELSREYAGFFAPYDHIADPLIDDADEGMTTALDPHAVRGAAARTGADRARDRRRSRWPTTAACAARSARRRSLRSASMSRRVSATTSIAAASTRPHHPFCTRFGAGDVRITTRVREDDLGDALFSTVHEAGHAMYEQGVSAALDGTPLGSGVSAGVHESQSRLWENVVGRSRAFWEHFFPALQRLFPDQFEACRSTPSIAPSTRSSAR